MAMKVGINGFGRIGRQVFKALARLLSRRNTGSRGKRPDGQYHIWRTC